MKLRQTLLPALLLSVLSLASCSNNAQKKAERHTFALEKPERMAAFVQELMSFSDVEEACRVVDMQFAKVDNSGDTTAFVNVAEGFRHYLYDPNSPYRDEDIYCIVAERTLRSSIAPDSLKAKAAMEVPLMNLNRRGTKAADFVFRDIKGHDTKLYSVEAEYTLLFFSNPGCTACREIIDILMGDQHLAMLIAQGKLAVVNVYIDEQLDEWREYQREYPDSWYNGYDPTFSIRKDLIYNIRAIPSLYLLTADKTVLLKDASNERMFNFLSRIPE